MVNNNLIHRSYLNKLVSLTPCSFFISEWDYLTLVIELIKLLDLYCVYFSCVVLVLL